MKKRRLLARLIHIAIVMMMLVPGAATYNVQAADAENETLPLDRPDLFYYKVMPLQEHDEEYLVYPEKLGQLMIKIYDINKSGYGDKALQTTYLDINPDVSFLDSDAEEGWLYRYNYSQPHSKTSETIGNITYNCSNNCYYTFSITANSVYLNNLETDSVTEIMNQDIDDRIEAARKDLKTPEFTYEDYLNGKSNTYSDYKFIETEVKGRRVYGTYESGHYATFNNIARSGLALNASEAIEYSIYISPEELGLPDCIQTFYVMSLSGSWEVQSNADCEDLMTGEVLSKCDEELTKRFHDVADPYSASFEQLYNNAAGLSFSPVYTHILTEEGKAYLAKTPEENKNEEGMEVLPGDQKEVVIDTQASEESGDDNGVSVPAIIVTGMVAAGVALAAGGVAIAGAGAAGGVSSGESSNEANSDEDSTPKSTYKMYLSKDFGDAIRYNEAPVPVYARMTEIPPNGTERNRPDLTAAIRISSGGNLTVENCMMAGEYMGAVVSCTKSSGGNNPNEGIVSFCYNGEGGTFTNNVSFRLIGDAYIDFTEQKAHMSDMYVNAVFGDNASYVIPFTLVDMTKPVEAITFSSNEYASVTYEQLSLYEYKAIIMNQTAPNNESVTEPVSVGFTVTAKNSLEKIENTFRLVLYPEGITVKANYVDGRIQVDTTKEEDRGDLEYKASRIELSLAYLSEESTPTAVIPDLKDVAITFDNLVGTDAATETLLTAFQYEINDKYGEDGLFYIEPLVTLPEAENPYYVTLRVQCNHNGNHFEKELAIRLLGEVPEPDKPWEEELRLVKRAVQRYGLTQNGFAQELIRHVDKRSVGELRMIRTYIIKEAVIYYTQEARDFESTAQMLEKTEFILYTVKWFGDQAFAYLVICFGGGPAVEAFMSPLKDMFASFIGECGASLLCGTEINFSAVQVLTSLESGVENTLVNMMTGMETPTPQKIGVLIASFSMLNFAKYYCFTDESKGDIYKTVLKMGSDFTVNAVKAILVSKIDKYLKTNPAFQRNASAFMDKYIKNALPEMTNIDAAHRYMEETIGLVGLNVYSNVTGNLTEDGFGKIGITIGDSTLTCDVLQNVKGFAKCMYDSFFSVLAIPEVANIDLNSK